MSNLPSALTFDPSTWLLIGLLVVLVLVMAAWRHLSLVAVNRDLRRTVEDRQRAEEDLRRLNEELEQRVARRTAALREREEAANHARAQMQEIIDAAPLPMVLLEIGTGTVLLANRAAETTFGISIGSASPCCTDGRCLAERDWKPLHKRLDDGDPIDQEEVRVCDSAGHPLWCLASFQLIDFDGHKAALGAFLDITERKATEESLRKLSLAVEKSPAVVVITDADGLIEYVNPRFTAVTGYSAEEVIGETPKVISSGAMSEDAYGEMWRTIAKGDIWHGDFENRHKDGSTYWVAASIAPILDDSGTITHYVSVQEDVTELRVATDALKASEERFHHALDFAAIGTWDWDIRTGALYWSEQIAPLFGGERGNLETSYEAFLAAIHPDDRTLVEEAVRACIEDGAEYDIEHRVVWPDGSVHWVMERGDSVRDETGKPTHMLGVVQDITDRKQAEAAVKKSEERLTTAIANITEGFALFDAEDRLIRCNAQYRNLYPRSLAAIRPGIAFEEMLRVGARQGEYPEAVGRIEAWIAERLEQRRQDHVTFEQRLSGGRWLRVTDQRLPNGERVSIRVDITELLQAKEQAEAANRAKSEFLSSMSHELRTPLNAILGFAQLLESGRKDTLSKRQIGHVRYILKAGQHLLDLINEVLDLARIESGRLPLEIAEVDTRGLLDECLSLTATQAENAGIRVEDLTTEAALPALKVDYTRTKQVLLNLLSNAVKYNRARGHVRLSAAVRGPALRISVADEGHGIPDSKRSLLFEPFHRLGAESTEIEGTGVGLTITKQLVESMEGRIDLESEEGKGSTFWVDLPLATAPEGDPDSADKSPD